MSTWIFRSIGILIAVLSLPLSHAAGQGHAPAFPEWRPSVAGWQTASGEPLVSVDGSAVPDPSFAGGTHQRIGRLWHTLTPGPTAATNASWIWPGGIFREPWKLHSGERYGSASIAQGAVVGARNWHVASGGDEFAYTHITNEAFRFSADGGNRPFSGDPAVISVHKNLENAQVQRWLPPQVIVNGVRYHNHTDSYGIAPGSAPAGNGEANFGAVRGVIDPGLVSERMVFSAWRFPIGVDVFQQVHAYSSGIDANYLLYDYRMVNTGNVDGDATTDRNAPLDNFRYAFAFSPDLTRMGNLFDGGGDDVVEFIEPWPSYTGGSGISKVLALTYDGDGSAVSGPDWGSPGGAYLTDGTYVGEPRLWSPAALMVGWIFAETAPGSGVDDPAQPMSTVWSDQHTYRITDLGNDMREQYRRIFSAKDFDAAYSADTDTTTYRIPAGPAQTSMGIPGFRPSVYQSLAYPSLGAGESLHAVLVVAAGGVNDSLNLRIADDVARRDRDPAVPVSERMSSEDIALVRSNRDSALKVADRAFWTVYGYDPEGRNGWLPKPVDRNTAFNVPDPPKPPGCVWVTSGPNRIDIQWTGDAETYPNHDTGVMDVAGYRVYRSDGTPNAPMRLIAEVPLGTHSYVDSSVAADVPYWYAVTTFNDGTQNWASPGESLESGRFWTWMGWYDQGVRAGSAPVPPDTDIENIRVVPNPYHAGAAGSRPSEIVWKNVPGPCTIHIFTAGGQPVHTIHASESSSRGIAWDLHTEWGQKIVPGVYIYVVECDAGNKVGKFVIVR